jgi:hypothetical protein
MTMCDPEEFVGKEVAMVYIAGRLGEAQRVEQILSQYQIDYMVDLEPFEVKILGFLPTRYDGVAFYVMAEHAALCRRVLREGELLTGLVEEEESE